MANARVLADVVRWFLFLMAFWSASRAWYHYAVTDRMDVSVLHAAATAAMLAGAIIRLESPSASRPLVSWWAALSSAATVVHTVHKDDPALIESLFLVVVTAIFLAIDYMDARIVRDAERAAEEPPAEETGWPAAEGAKGR